MKTSATQFEMLVNFMEQHGDINKPRKNAHGRIQAIQEWDTIKSLLNADPTGDIKTTEKWKKVWSDLKNNTKKKAAKINRAACGTGGGPALQAQLSQLEQRVLNIMGPQAATGLQGVAEAGFIQDLEDSNRTVTLPPSPTPALFVPETESPTIFAVQETIDNIQVPEEWNQPGPSCRIHIPPQMPAPLSPTPQVATSPAQVGCTPAADLHYPAHHGHTPRRRRATTVRRTMSSPRRRIIRQQSHVEQAAQHFLDSDECWRNFLQNKHSDEIEMQREKLRLRERELEAQQRWQEISMHAIAALNKIIDSRLFKD